jgi:4-amino-4-deoxy-L-arabinose transferase-like glycosyltransferase
MNFDPTSDYVFNVEGVFGQFQTQAVLVLQQIWFWLYVFLSGIILLNVLLSIIVGAFIDLQNDQKDRSMTFTFASTMHICTYFFIADCGAGWL